MHYLPLNPGSPRGEVPVWTDDVDEAFALCLPRKASVVCPSHDCLITPPLRATWFEDPEGNPTQIVCHQRKQSYRPISHWKASL